jgi:hypothetical protein
MDAAKLLNVFLVAVFADLQVRPNKINSPSTPIASPLPASPLCCRSHPAAASLSNLIRSPFPLPPFGSDPSHSESPTSPSTVHSAPSNQAAHPSSTPDPFRIYRHRPNNEPPTNIEDDSHLLTDAGINIIFGSSVMFFLDGIFRHYKPTHGEALPHHCTTASVTPLLQFAGDLLSRSVLRSRDLFVIGLFHKGLDVFVLL